MCSAPPTRFHATMMRIDCTKSALNTAVDKGVAAECWLSCGDPSMSWQNWCIHRCQFELIPARCQRIRWALNRLSIGVTGFRLTFSPLSLVTIQRPMHFHRCDRASIYIVDSGTKSWLGSLIDWACAQVARVQVPTNIAAVWIVLPIRELVPARTIRVAFVYSALFRFYAAHSETMSPLVGCLSLLWTNWEMKEKLEMRKLEKSFPTICVNSLKRNRCEPMK